MKQSIVAISIALFFVGCKITDESNSLSKITISTEKTTKHASDFFVIRGFSAVKPPSNMIGVGKVVEDDGYIYIMDNESDYKNIFQFDQKSGSFLRQIGKQWEGNNPHQSLRDFFIEKNGDVSLLSDEKMSIFQYDASGIFLEKIPLGMIGDKVVRDKSDKLIVYNELSETPVSKNNRLCFYDKKGNLVGRTQKYNQKLENVAYDFSGFLSNSGSLIVYSPPFCDTIFQIIDKKPIPLFYIDFGKNTVPEIVRENKIDFSQTADCGFLGEQVVTIGSHLVLFEYQLQNIVRKGIFDQRNDMFYDMANLIPDELGLLIRKGLIFPKSDSEFLVILNSQQVQRMIEKKEINQESLNQVFSGLGDCLTNFNSNYLVLQVGLQP